MAETAPVKVRILPDPYESPIGVTGPVSTAQEAELELPAALLAELWRPEYLERLARSYWRYLNRISLGLLRVVYSPSWRTLVLGWRRLALMRFRRPEYQYRSGWGQVTWRLERGLLVARQGRGRGYLRLTVERRDDGTAKTAVVRVRSEVASFYPWLRGRGWFARIGRWVYAQTQMRVHVIVTHGFLRDLARLDLPPSEVGALRGELNDERPG
jgi:hypothetical protein